MKFSEFFKTKDNIYLDRKTLAILRWIAIIGQLITINVVFFILKFEFLFSICFLIIFIGAISNFYLHFFIKENQLNNFASTSFLFYD